MDGYGQIGLTLTLLLVLLGLLLLVLWIVLPFAVFSSRRLLRDLVRETRRTNELLAAQRANPAAKDYGPDGRTSPNGR